MQITSTCIVIVGKFSLLFLQLPFGTTLAPEEYTEISEAEIDMLHDLLVDTSWYATGLKSPRSHLLSKE